MPERTGHQIAIHEVTVGPKGLAVSRVRAIPGVRPVESRTRRHSLLDCGLDIPPKDLALFRVALSDRFDVLGIVHMARMSCGDLCEHLRGGRYDVLQRARRNRERLPPALRAISVEIPSIWPFGQAVSQQEVVSIHRLVDDLRPALRLDHNAVFRHTLHLQPVQRWRRDLQHFAILRCREENRALRSVLGQQFGHT